MTQETIIQWDPIEAAIALEITLQDHLMIQTDGRKAYYFAYDWLLAHGWNRVSDGKSGWLLVKDGKRWRLRVMTKSISFAPSVSKGAGRQFNLNDFNTSVGMLDGFLFFRALDLPNAKVYSITINEVISLRQAKVLDYKFATEAINLNQWISSKGLP